MIALLRFWLDLCLLRAAPQDAPASVILLLLVLAGYLVLSVLALGNTYGMAAGGQVALAELGLLSAFVAALLYIAGKPARVVQTLASLAGAGCVLGAVSLLLALSSGPVTAGSKLPAVLSLAWLLMVVWNLVVTAHIMRHALSVSWFAGLGVSLLYMVISMQFVATLFPGLTETAITQ